MVIRSRLRSILFPLMLYCVSASVGSYFVWHAVNGERGLKAKAEFKAKIYTMRIELAELRDEKSRLARNIDLIRGETIDRDLLDDLTRKQLGRAGKNDLVIMVPNATQKP